MGTQNVSADSEFNALQFEKTLASLKDSQETINACCQWCLANRQHYKKIVSSWLNVLKRVKVEQRLILFYLANDVVQYSKRRNYEYVDTWGTAIQKATTMVRDEKVKHKILRIFKIWEQRAVYGEEFIADLCGLISIQPTGGKNEEQPHEFQASYVINKIKSCANLERDTDKKLKILKEHNPKIQITEGFINSLKDRVHVDDVEKEVDVYTQHMENYINALKSEIKSRIALISVLKQAETQLESDRKDVKLVAHAYKTFGQRVKVFQKKLEEHMENLPSPIPSPDINAPSPSPDSDLDLPEESPKKQAAVVTTTDNEFNDLQETIQFTNPGYYNPVTASMVTSATTDTSVINTSSNISGTENNLSFLSNGFTSFLGQNLSFDITNISTTGLFSNSVGDHSTVNNTQTTNSYVTAPSVGSQPPLPVESPNVTLNNTAVSDVYNPLLPPPMPPFSKNNESDFSFNSTADISSGGYNPAYLSESYAEPAYTTETALGSLPNQTHQTHYDYQIQTGVNPYPPEDDRTYDPSDMPSTWENVENPEWPEKDTDTPESPPMFEKEGYGDPVEYHDNCLQDGSADVDHRVIPGLGDLGNEDSLNSIGGKDVDHRNLISLTGSPGESVLINGANPPPPPLPERGNLKTIPTQDSLWDSTDQDYRSIPTINPPPPSDPPPLPTSGGILNQDQDYRLQFGLDNLNLPPPLPPPPPPPPPKSPDSLNPPPPPPTAALERAIRDSRDPRSKNKSPRKGDILMDNVDMDLSDDVETSGLMEGDSDMSLQPPPPLPDLLDDVDANQFLDEISNDLNEFSNLSAELDPPLENNSEEMQTIDHVDQMPPPDMWQQGPPQPPMPPQMSFMGPPGMPPGGFMPVLNNMEMGHPQRQPLLSSPMMDGPPLPGQLPPPPNWMGDQPPWAFNMPHNMPPFQENNPYEDENPYLYEDEENVDFFPLNPENFQGQNFVLRGRGGLNNFRGGPNFRGGFNKGEGFRGRGRGARGAGNRGGRGNRGRGVGVNFRSPRGNRGRGR